jgi:hypothetical protein
LGDGGQIGFQVILGHHEGERGEDILILRPPVIDFAEHGLQLIPLRVSINNDKSCHNNFSNVR